MVLLLPGLQGMESASLVPALECATVQSQDLGVWDDAFCLAERYGICRATQEKVKAAIRQMGGSPSLASLDMVSWRHR